MTDVPPTLWEQIAQAFPLHAQRIAELVGPRDLEGLRTIRVPGSPGHALSVAFAFVKTSEGYDYWAALARGAGWEPRV